MKIEGGLYKRYLNWFHGLFETDVFTYREIRGIFLPLLLDQVFIQALAFLSTSLVSSVGEAAMAAVTMVNTLGVIINSIFGALSIGGGIVIAQAKGSGDFQKLKRAVGEMTSLSFLVTLVTSAIMFFFAEPMIRMIYPRSEPLLLQYAVEFMKLLAISEIPFCIFNAIFTAFRSVGDAKSSLVLTIFINVLHLLLSLLFINVMGLGVRGSGYSLIVARALGCLLAVVWILRPRGIVHLQLSDFFHINLPNVKEISRLGIPAGIEQVLFQSGMLMVQGYLSRWGETPAMGTFALAGHAVASSCFNLIVCIGFTVAALDSTVCGQCIGAKRMDLFKRYTKNMVKGSQIVLLVADLVLLPLMPLIMKLYHPNPDAAPMIMQMILLGSLPMPLIWSQAFVTVNSLRAAGDSTFPTIVALVSLLLGRVLLGQFLTINCNLGPIGIWISMLVEWLIRMAAMEWRMRSGTWEKHLTRHASA